MKFINYLEKISGIESLGLFSLLLFFLFFITMLIWVFRINQSELQEASNIPLESSSTLSKR